MPEVSERIQLDNQSRLPLVRLQASPGECLQSQPPPPKSTGPASVKTGGGGSSSGASSGTSYASVVKGETGPAENAKEEKNTQQKKAESIEKLLATMDKDDPLREDLENQLEQLRAALKDPRNPGARLDSAMAKMRKAKAKVEKCQEQLHQAEAPLKAAHAEEEEANSELKAAQENAVPKSELPPVDAAMQLSSEDISDLTDMLKQCGLLAVAACEDASEAQAKKARVGPYDNPRKTPREIAKLANPALVARLANSMHILQDAVKSGGDGSLEETQPGDPEALRGLSPPATSKSCRTSDSTDTPEPARRERTQRNHERHRNPEPAQCTDAGLVPPRESLVPADKVHLQSPGRALRKPGILWLCLSLFFSSPGSSKGTGATCMLWPATGATTAEARWQLAPGDDPDGRELQTVPFLRCSEHESSLQSNIVTQERAPPRCTNPQQADAGTSLRRTKRTGTSGRKVPGTMLSSIMSDRQELSLDMVMPALHAPMSDMWIQRLKKRKMSDIKDLLKANRCVPGMTTCPQGHGNMSDMQHEHLSFCTCSHVGYKKFGRLATCPGQCAHARFSRFETCPGQHAHSSNSRSAETCPGQRAHRYPSRPETCPGQCALRLHCRSKPCSEQLCSRYYACSEQLTLHRSNCPGQPDLMAESREKTAALNDELAELKFWTYSIGCKNLRDCLERVPASWKSFDVPQSDWWTEPGISQRRDALRELTTVDITHVVDTRCLRDMEGGSASRHLGTNVVNMRGMCHNNNMKGLIKDIWSCIEDLLREAFKHARPGTPSRCRPGLRMQQWKTPFSLRLRDDNCGATQNGHRGGP